MRDKPRAEIPTPPPPFFRVYLMDRISDQELSYCPPRLDTIRVFPTTNVIYSLSIYQQRFVRRLQSSRMWRCHLSSSSRRFERPTAFKIDQYDLPWKLNHYDSNGNNVTPQKKKNLSSATPLTEHQISECSLFYCSTENINFTMKCNTATQIIVISLY